MSKKNPYDEYFKSMNEEKEQAEIDYKIIMEQDKDKTFMDLLPPEFKNFKRSVIKRTILTYIDKVTEVLNSCSLYDGKVFDKKEVVRYMMRGTGYSNFYLAHKFIPRRDSTSLWMKYVGENTKKGEFDKNKLDGLYKKFESENKDIIKEYEDVDYLIRCLEQTWDSWEDRQKVKKRDPEHMDMEPDGFPRTGRGNLCNAFIPVKGELPKNKTGVFNLLNPRNKKTLEYKITGYKAEDHIYSCLNEKGKTVFLINHEDVADAWDCLFTSNKEIYSGWWNRTLILK